MAKRLPITKKQRAQIQRRARQEGEQRMIRAFRYAMFLDGMSQRLVHDIVATAIGYREESR